MILYQFSASLAVIFSYYFFGEKIDWNDKFKRGVYNEEEEEGKDDNNRFPLNNWKERSSQCQFKR